MAAALAWLSGHLDDSSLERLIAAADMTTTSLWRSGDYATAERVALGCLDAPRRPSDDHPARLSAHAQLAHVVAVTWHAEAEQMFRDLLRDQQRVRPLRRVAPGPLRGAPVRRQARGAMPRRNSVSERRNALLDPAPD